MLAMLAKVVLIHGVWSIYILTLRRSIRRLPFLCCSRALSLRQHVHNN
jgi:hypothetical protein